MMSNYTRVLPRDLFNEASLLKCYGALWIALDNVRYHDAEFNCDSVDAFDISQNEESGGIYVNNIDLLINGYRCDLERPLNSREPWPLYVVSHDDNHNFEPVAVFDDYGDLSTEMMTLIGAR